MVYIVIITAVLAVIMFVMSVLGLKDRRILSSTAYFSVSVVMMAISALLFSLALNLHTYNRLTHEQEVAELSFRTIGPMRYRVAIEFADLDGIHRFEINGDEWQMDAKLLKWKGVANLLGMDAMYRLHRLSGRYKDINLEKNNKKSVYALSTDAGMDVWSLSQEYQQWLPWIDAIYGSATYLPMFDRAHYRVSVTQSGLIARPVNSAVDQALK